jgi:hypothetical protein
MKKSTFTQGLLAVTLLLTAVSVQAQPETMSREDLNGLSSSKVIRVVSTTEYNGSPYLTPDWQKGHVMMNELAKSQVLMMRYNAHKNHVEYFEDDAVFMISPDRIAGFVIYTNDGDIVFKNGFESEEHDINRATLMRVIYDGSIKLLQHHKVLLKDGMQTYGSATNNKRFVEDNEYYFVDREGKFHEVKRLREKDILRLLDDKKDELKKYAKAQKLDFDKEDDLKILLKHYESL